MQANELHKFTVTLTASHKFDMRLIESCHVDMVPCCSANPFCSGKDKNKDEQEDFTGLQYFKRPVKIS